MTSPLDRAGLARRSGLHQEAVQELRKAHDQFQKQLGEEKKKFTSDELAQQFVVLAELIELLMYDGHVEEAAQFLETLDTPDTLALMRDEGVRRAHAGYRQRLLSLVNPERPFSPYDGDPAGHFRMLRLAVALGVGDYPTAIDAQKKEIEGVVRERDAFRALHFPAGPPPAGPSLSPFAAQVHLWYGALLGPLSPVPAHLGGVARVAYAQRVDRMRGLAQALVNAHMQMALIQLEYGDVSEAAHHFRRALESPEFPDPLPFQRMAQQYLAAIEKARGGP
jgi:tetratricopeptide (TPR) repeat protein